MESAENEIKYDFEFWNKVDDLIVTIMKPIIKESKMLTVDAFNAQRKAVAEYTASIRKECADRAIGYCESNRLVKGWQVELRAAIEGKK